ncbi:hypothetical protein, partial [Halobacillus sp. BBL2006]|uniref:hypothetical protein n=1 Tax=Halobacillus sp. BBL2006 TaxID=1543706 RepID=UPI000541AEC8
RKEQKTKELTPAPLLEEPPNETLKNSEPKRKWIDMIWNWDFWTQTQEADDKDGKQETETKLTKLENEIEELKALVSQMNKTILTYQQNEEAHLKQIEELKEQIASLKEKTSTQNPMPSSDQTPNQSHEENQNTQLPKTPVDERKNLPQHPQSNHYRQNANHKKYPHSHQRQANRQQPGQDDSVFNPFKYYRKDQ